MMKRNIAIIAGGDSSEYEVSLKSAAGLDSFIDKEQYDRYLVTIKQGEWVVHLPEGKVPIDKNDFSFLESGEKRRFDFAYITIHGTPGEDGRLQAYFDLIGLPYSSCGMLASAVTFNKFVCNQYLHNFGVKIARSIHLFRGEHVVASEVVQQLGLPLFVKPSDGGSSFGVTKVLNEDEIQPAIEKAFREGKEVVIESFIEGTEVTCGIYKTRKDERILPVTEVVTENEFFDYNAKYNGQVREITPARLSQEWTERVQAETSKIYDLLGAKGLIRVDYIIPADGEPVLLEVNTTPGMTATSFIPQQVRAAGLDIHEVMTEIIENELNA